VSRVEVAKALPNVKFIKFVEQKPVDRGNGALTYPLVSGADGTEAFTAGITAFQPGVGVPLHSHNAEEMVTVLEGEGECVIDGVRRPVNHFDTTLVPANVVHCFRNTGRQRMSIMWVYGSTSVTRTFADTGVTVQHLSPNDTIGRGGRVSRAVVALAPNRHP
jgi:quercetin dioxygenase-like cupin family protein